MRDDRSGTTRGADTPANSYGTYGELPMWAGFAGIPRAGVSQHSFHPNGLGAGLMTAVGTDLIADVY